MKIIFVNRFFYPDHSATSQLLSDLAFNLAQTGLPILIVTSRQVYDDEAANLPSNEFIRQVCVRRVWTTRFGRQNLLGRTLDYLTFSVSAAWILLVLFKPGDIVVAKTDPPLISVVVAIVAKFRKVKMINWVQDLFPEVAGALRVGGLSRFSLVLRAIRNWSLKFANKNVVIGGGMAAKLIAEDVRPGALEIIHNWADGFAIQPVDREINDLRRKWDLQEKFVVGYSGNIGRAHEFDTILDAAEKLADMTNIIFLFIGGGAQREWIGEQARKRGLKNVMFKPYQPRTQLACSLSVPDAHFISLQPSLEGLIVPSKFYGILAAGRPTIFIGGKDGEIPGILMKEQCGFSVEIGQPEEVSRIVRELVDHKELCFNLGKRARTLFDQQFDMRHAMQAWEAVIAATRNPKSSVS